MKQHPTLYALTAATVLLTGCASNSDPVSPQASPGYSCETSQISQADDLRIYQVMVESFVNGNDAIGHGTGYGTSHHKGDLQGIINSLDYIQSLGVNTIWLTPIFESAPQSGQDHWADRLDATGYFASNYFKIDPRFGTLDDAKRLVDEAHKRGIYVLLDGVFGHHKSSGVEPSPSGLLPSGANNPVSYPESLPFYKEVAEYWIKELKIDGWRLDQAYQVPLEAWQKIRQAVDEASKTVTYTNDKGELVNPLGYMVAEIWAGENRIKEAGFGTDENPGLCSAFDFPVRNRLVETFAVNENGVGNKDGEWLKEGMDLHNLYPSQAKPNLMIGNHDLVRFGDLLQRGSITQPDNAEYWNRHKAVLAFQAAYSGPITLYYGEEIGDEVADFANKVNSGCAVQGLCDDHVARSSGKIEGVTAELNAEQKDLLQYTTQLMALRDQHPALSSGERINIQADKTSYIDLKRNADESILYTASLINQPQTLTFTSEQLGSAGDLVDLISGQTISAVEGQYSIELSALQARFIRVLTPTESGPVIVQAKESSGVGEGFMAQCNNPTVEEKGPIKKRLYVVGDFADSGWVHVDSRQFQYKGDGIYQVVVNEKAGSYRMQYAAKNWHPQFTATSLSLKLGEVDALKNGGYGTDTAVTIKSEGNIVWSLKFDEQGEPLQVMASRCSE